jgi:hypothetical protein
MKDKDVAMTVADLGDYIGYLERLRDKTRGKDAGPVLESLIQIHKTRYNYLCDPASLMVGRISGKEERREFIPLCNGVWK